MAPTEDEVRDVVRQVLAKLAATPDGAAAAVAAPTAPAAITPAADAGESTTTKAVATREPPRTGRRVIDETQVRGVASGARLTVPQGALVTPLAREAALARGVSLVSADLPDVSASRVPAQQRVAIGADHGGYSLKEALKPHLQGLGYEVVDCGTHSSDAVDYPDLAYAVARLVADGKCANGIVVDGAGIGSCMAANKVPGIRAALCYDHATAVNSREHNHANVLTLGAGLIGANLAKQIVSDWLATPYGSGRHAMRVEKIMAIEKRYLKS